MGSGEPPAGDGNVIALRAPAGQQAAMRCHASAWFVKRAREVDDLELREELLAFAAVLDGQPAAKQLAGRPRGRLRLVRGPDPAA